MITELEMKQHLCRMLPDVGYEPGEMNERSESKVFAHKGPKFETVVAITRTGYVSVSVQRQGMRTVNHVARCHLGDVIIGKGHTVIGSFIVEH